MNSTLYHITPKANLVSIISVGLRSNIGKKGMLSSMDGLEVYHDKYDCQPIFLTNDIEYVTNNMLTLEWIHERSPIALKIHTKPYKIFNVVHNCSIIPIVDTKEFICYEDILPEHIEILKLDIKTLKKDSSND
jgi:hypothetical protein